MYQRTPENPYRRNTTKLDENLDLRPVAEQAKYCLDLVWKLYFQERGVTRKEFDSKPPYYSFDPLQRMGQWIIRGYIDLPVYFPQDFPFFELFEMPKNLQPDFLHAERMRRAMEAFEKKRYAPEARAEFEQRLKALDFRLNHYPEISPEEALKELKKKYARNDQYLNQYLSVFMDLSDLSKFNPYMGLSDALRILVWLKLGYIDFKDENSMKGFVTLAKEGYSHNDTLQYWLGRALQPLSFKPIDPKVRKEFEDDLFELGFVVVKYPPIPAKK